MQNINFESNYKFLEKELAKEGKKIEYRPVIVTIKEIKTKIRKSVAAKTETVPEVSGKIVKNRKRNRDYARTYARRPGKCVECGLEDKMNIILSHQASTSHKGKELLDKKA